MFRFTGGCRICVSPKGQQITAMQVSGAAYAQIIESFPDEKLSKPVLSHHKKHYLTEKSWVHGSDQEFVDELRDLGLTLVGKAKDGAELSFVESRLLETAQRAVSLRHQVVDSEGEATALQKLMEQVDSLEV